jgi:hypothetical protein
VIVNNLNIEGIAVQPLETKAPLVTDPDTVLALAASFEGFKPIAGEPRQIAKGCRGIEDRQSLFRLSDERLELPDTPALENMLSPLVPECPYHTRKIGIFTLYVKPKIERPTR